MSNNLQVALLSGLLSGGFAVVGATANSWSSGRRERRRFRTEAALELAGVERRLYDGTWVDLQTFLGEQEARLSVAGIAGDLITALRESATICWRDNRDTLERAGGEHGGINVELLSAYHSVANAIRAQLLRTPGRRERTRMRRDAVAAVDAIFEDDRFDLLTDRLR